MSNDPTPEQVRASIVPKSDQLNADDLITGPITVTITAVRRGDKDQPIIIDLDGLRPYKPCKSMRRVLIAAWGDDPKRWVGQMMTLFCDPDVLWAGVKVGGIRISHLSGMESPRTFMLTKSRGKRSEVTVGLIVRPKPATLSLEDQEFIATAREELAGAETLDVLKGYAEVLKGKPKPVQDALRPVYRKRQEELQAQAHE